jgi:hypothetical protein
MVLTMKSSKRLLITFLILCGFTMQTDLAISKPNKSIRHFPVRMLEGDWEMAGFYSRTLDVSKVPVHPSYWDEESYFAPGSKVRFTFPKDQGGYYPESIAIYKLIFLKPYPVLLCKHKFYKYLCESKPPEQDQRHVEFSVDPIDPKKWLTDAYEYAPKEIAAKFKYYLGGPPLGSKINSYIIFENKDQFYMEQIFYETPADENDPDHLKAEIAGTVGLIFKRIKSK